MIETEFVRTRSQDWDRLQSLCERGTNLKSLSSRELDEVLLLYRRVCTDLALARTQDANESIIFRLNTIVQMAYGMIYLRPKKGILRIIVDAIQTVARSVRRQAKFVGVSVSLFLIFSVVTGIASAMNSNVMTVLVPAGGMQENADAWVKGLPARSSTESMLATGGYASNNPLAAVTTTSLSVGTLGLGSVVELYQNAAMIGALATKMARVGKLPFLILSILPHGVPELSGFMIAAAAGMALGWNLIRPGNRTRIRALAETGKDVVPMMAGAVVLMWIAAPIEGWFSYDPRVPLAVKGVFILIEAIAWGMFWTLCGRNSDQTSP